MADDTKQLRNNIIKTENKLAKLHATIYKRREEARNIRLSLTQDGEKTKKASCSLFELKEKTDRDLEKYLSSSNKKFVSNLLIIVIVLFVFLTIYYFFYTRE